MSKTNKNKLALLNFATQMLDMLNQDRRYCHHWAVENPHANREVMRSGRTSKNVWCGIVDNK